MPQDSVETPKNGHRLTFIIETYGLWSPKGIEEIANEFQLRYDGNMAIRSAWLNHFEEYEYQDDNDGNLTDEEVAPYLENLWPSEITEEQARAEVATLLKRLKQSEA